MDAADSAVLWPGRKRRTAPLMKIASTAGGGGTSSTGFQNTCTRVVFCDKSGFSKKRLARVQVKRPEAAGRLKSPVKCHRRLLLVHWTPLRLRRLLAPSSDVT